MQENEGHKGEELRNVKALVEKLTLEDKNETFVIAMENGQLELAEMILKNCVNQDCPFPPKYWDGNQAFRRALETFQTD